MSSYENKATKRKLFDNVDLTRGPIVKGMLQFMIPMFIGQLLQQLYNIADAWVVGNFADTNAFAAVSSSGNLIFLIIGLCNGLSIGGGVIISRYFGAKDEENTSKAVHNNVLMGIGISVIATLLGLFFVPVILQWMSVPPEVLPDSLTYFRIYFVGVSTVVMYNIFTSIMRSIGDSIRPLYYLMVSSICNVILDVLFVAGFHWGVAGAAGATVFSQGLAAILCLIRMLRVHDASHLEFKKLRYDHAIMKEVLVQGIPTGIQNSVISIGNAVIQANINAFGTLAMAGHGAYARIEGFVFLPVMCISMSLPTFVSQNLGAGDVERARKGSKIGVIMGMISAELVGLLVILTGRFMLRFFIDDPAALEFGWQHISITAVFYFLLAFSHCCAGVLRGCGKSIVPMFAMLADWCGFRIVYVSFMVYLLKEYWVIPTAYPVTWTITTIIFGIFLFRMNWYELSFVRKVPQESKEA